MAGLKHEQDIIVDIQEHQGHPQQGQFDFYIHFPIVTDGFCFFDFLLPKEMLSHEKEKLLQKIHGISLSDT